jgi:hypothetical protein
MPQRHLLAIPLLLVTGLAWAAGQAVSFLGLTSEVPAEWVSGQPSSTMRLLQFDIPGGEGGDGAQFVVYFFGPGQGGSLDANLERWASQFSGPDGKPVEPVVTPLKSTMPATLVELRGSYARNVGMGQSGDALPDRMLPPWWRRRRATSIPSSTAPPSWSPPSAMRSSDSSRESAPRQPPDRRPEARRLARSEPDGTDAPGPRPRARKPAPDAPRQAEPTMHERNAGPDPLARSSPRCLPYHPFSPTSFGRVPARLNPADTSA